MNLSTKQIAISGILIAIALVLGITSWGFIPLPTPAGAATTMHIPVILAGILEGPYVGALVGVIFGLFAWQKFPAFDIVVHLVPRFFIGIVAWFVFIILYKILYKLNAKIRISIASGMAAVFGTLTNTFGCLYLSVKHGIIPPSTFWPLVITHGIPEVILAVIITLPIVIALKTME